MQTAWFILYLACVFGVTFGLAKVGRKAWYPKRFALAVALSCTVVLGSVTAFGMWSRANTIDRGEQGPANLMP